MNERPASDTETTTEHLNRVGGWVGRYAVVGQLDRAAPAHLRCTQRPSAAGLSGPLLRMRVETGEVGTQPNIVYDQFQRSLPAEGLGWIESSAVSMGVAVQLATTSATLRWVWPVQAPMGVSTALLLERSWILTMQALALGHGGIVLHGASVVVDGQASVIVGQSGAGKSTLAARLGSQGLHDDVCLVARQGGQWQVWAQNVYRPYGSATTGVFPLRRLLLLGDQRDRTVTEPLPAGQAAMLLLAQTFDASGAAEHLLADAVQDLINELGMAKLNHSLTDGVDLLRAALEGER
ncbi:MAG: hypothetical protein EXR77_07485 [Myxococcales bacterium]|nr:hypothetical protein [Myxococcales bacterium]